MKKFQFSLKRVQGYKEQILQREKNALMQLNAQRRATEEDIAQALQLLDALGVELREETARGTTVANLKRMELQIDSAHHHIKQLEEHLKVLKQNIERQIQVVVAATQEVSSLEKLEEKQKEAYNIEVARDDEAVISEFVSTQVIRRKGAEQPAS